MTKILEHGQTYKHYLYFLQKERGFWLWQKIVFLVFSLLVISIGAFSAFSFYFSQKEAPVAWENQYLQTVSEGFVTTGQFFHELLASFQVAGAKINIVESLKESSDSASGFFVLQDDLDKTLAKIETIKKSILFQKETLLALAVPLKFEGVHGELLNFYTESLKILGQLYAEHNFARKILLAAGPDLYLPVVSNELLWQSAKSEEITAYYQRLKQATNNALANFSQLEPPADLTQYYQTQMTYLELLVKTADQIINILSQKDDPNPEIPSQIEKAYQVLVNAKKENEILAQRLLSQKLGLFSTKENLAKLAPLKIQQNALAAKLADLSSTQLQPKTFQLPEFLQGIFKTN